MLSSSTLKPGERFPGRSLQGKTGLLGVKGCRGCDGCCTLRLVPLSTGVKPGAPGETALQGAIRAELGEAYSGSGLLEEFFFSESV